eukprot:jgi/Mesen1/9249/ME000006S09250
MLLCQRGGSTSLTPLTVKQISLSESKAGDDSIIVDGCPVKNVTCVGKIVNKALTATTCNFVLDDGTGTIEVTKWLASDAAESAELDSIEPVTDHNEVTHHSLECIYVHLAHTKGQGQSGQAAPDPAGAFGGARAQPGGIAPATPAGNISQYGNQYVAPPAAAANMGGGGVSDLQAKVLAIYEEPANAEAIAFLQNEGALYSTIDDDHFKSTGV